MRQSIYETGQYLANKPDWHAGHAPVKAGWISEILDRNRISPKSIVEIGCGAGEILVRLAEIYPAATLEGYDISPQAFAIASPKETDRLKFHHRNFLEEPAKAIDLLMAIDVFEHVEDYMAFIRGLKGRSRYALFHIPLDLSVQMVLRSKPILHVRDEVGHLHYFYKDTALATLTDCGFEILDWNYTHHAGKPLRRSRHEKLMSIPRKIMRAINEDFAVRVLGGSSLMVLAA